MKIYGTVTDISEKTPLENVKLRFSVDETVLMTVFTDERGVFEAEQDLSDYVGKQLKVKVQQENFEDKAVSYEIGQEDIEISIELTAIKPVEIKPVIPIQPPVEKKQEHLPPEKNNKPIIIGAAVCAIILAVIAIYFMMRPDEVSIVSFTAEPASIMKGRQSTLRWKTKNAVSVTIDEIGKVNNSGSKKIKPNNTTTYTLMAKGKKSEKSKSCKVRVTPKIMVKPMIKMETVKPKK